MSTAKSAMNAVVDLVRFEGGIIAGSVVRFFVVVAVVKRFLGKIWDLVVGIRNLSHGVLHCFFHLRVFPGYPLWGAKFPNI